MVRRMEACNWSLDPRTPGPQLASIPLDMSEIFDSLPYYDDDLDQDPLLQELVQKEIAKEPKPSSEPHPNLPPAFELFTVRSLPFVSS